ncbi:MAG: 16S rRNA (guanine(966)-N(2))-methyltransferase RsmD [Actinomycetota bacterium]|nr:16S rRNA (guanine(966)-N(2))-methyltransferase RsmD [Actinomycetota bacterium]
MKTKQGERPVRLRIIAGSLKGRKINGSHGPRTRPTSDKVREAIFSSLGERVGGARVLDLYAGSGAMGIEALSRGAAQAVFVEAASSSAALIDENLASLGLKAYSNVKVMPVETFMSDLGHERFDLIFLDPPYDEPLPWHDLEALAAAGAMPGGAFVVIETASRNLGDDLAAPLGFALRGLRSYGDTAVIHLIYEDN